MKKRNLIKYSLLLPSLLLCLFFTSCEVQDSVENNTVELLSFGPSGVKPGENISIIGRNLDRVSAIEIAGLTIEQNAFISQSKELISLKIPVNTNEGFLMLKTDQGDIVSKTMLSFNVAVKINEMTTIVKPGQTITLKGEYLNWVREVHFAKSGVVKTFESQSLNELVVKVPMEAETGPLTIFYSGTKAESLKTEEILEVSLPKITSFGPVPAKRDENLTIYGSDLDLVKGVIFKGMTSADTVFISQNQEQIVIAIPAGANKGKISVMAFSGIIVESEESLAFVGDLPELPALAYTFYEDGLQNNWQNWGWGSTADFGNADNVRQGTKAAKLNFTGSWGALKFANSSVKLADYAELTFSIFGGPGTNGKTFNMSANDGKSYAVAIKEGEWTEYKIKFSEIGSPASINTLMFQETGWKGIVYFDHIGLR